MSPRSPSLRACHSVVHPWKGSGVTAHQLPEAELSLKMAVQNGGDKCSLDDRFHGVGSSHTRTAASSPPGAGGEQGGRGLARPVSRVRD